jgi:hypothetical protein
MSKYRSKYKHLYITVLALIPVLGAPAYADSGHDFVTEARLFYRAVACAGEEPVAGTQDGLDARVVGEHCKAQQSPAAKFRRRYMDKAGRFLGRHRPAELPGKVVYPFGGGDLISALIAYPDAAEVTTISLEHAGDPRRLAGLDAPQLRTSLALYRQAVSGLLRNHDSASENLRKLEKGPIPGQLAFFLLALALTDHEPISLRFFRIEPDGSLHYYSRAEIEELDDTVARKKAHRWVDTDYSVAFSNAEIQFRRRGAGPAEPARVHRHIVFNLNNQNFPDSPLHKHLERKGAIAAMTKAASYLLWMNNFSGIRNYLLRNMKFMISDSTGIPPLYARKAGFRQVTFGTYTGPFLPAGEKHDQAFVALWAGQPKRALPFRYGYPDAAGNYHLLLTIPKARPAPRAKIKPTKK